MYAFVNGPLIWIAFAVLVLGSLWQIVSLRRMSKRTDKVFYDHYNAGGAAASVWAWMMPYGSRGWREHPGLTFVTFIFHVCLIVTPLFALGHITTLQFNRNFGWPTLPDRVITIMTLLFLASALVLLIRRLAVPEVRIVTEAKDIVLWVIVVLPFLTGYLSANNMLFSPDLMLMLHVLTGCLMLLCIPFTKLAHVFLFFMTRAFIGSEFARRGTKTW